MTPSGRASRGRVLALSVGICFALALLGALAYVHSRGQGLPYRDSFKREKADEWKALGGTWELAGGSMRNDSAERGAKLLTGSPRWTDYSIEADVMLLGPSGDAGLMLRSSGEEQGVDAYTGYYAGLRTLDNVLLLGRAGHGWVEMTEPLKLTQAGVNAMQWYHLKVLAYGCHFAVTASLADKPSLKPVLKTAQAQAQTTLAITDESCIRSGRAGLRSYASGGVWRNVAILPAKEADWLAIQAMAGKSRSTLAGPAPGPGPWDVYEAASTVPPGASLPSPDMQVISSLRLAPSSQPVMATVRGAVVLASPALFVQDATGGVAVQQTASQALKVGDEVEVTGRVRARAFSPSLEQANVRLLWENSPMPPVSITASQAATGAFDATFVEVEGRLTGKQHGPDDSLLFHFDAGPQSFEAVMNRGRGDTLYNELKPGSMLRLRGVAVSDPVYTRDLVPFALLLRSSDDAVVMAGPPWWSAGHLLAIAAALLLLALLANFAYHRVESWRLRAVLEERERMAFEMHDTLSQSFAGIGFQLKAIREDMPEQFPRLHQQLELASELVRHSHEETRRSIAVLRPEQPGAGDLLTALRECANRLVEGGSVEIVVTCTGDATRVPLRVADTLYHIGQEALANAVRHGQPATLSLRLVCEKERVHLLIQDDGRGFTPVDDLPGFGLRGMRKRAAGIGATLAIRSAPSEGTEVWVQSRFRTPGAFTRQPAVAIRELWRQIRYGANRADPNTHRG